jgi:hypothetical protein
VSLLQPGELPALRVADPAVFDVVLAALQKEEQEHDATDAPPALSRILASVRSLACPESGHPAGGALALVERCAGILKEFDCRVRYKDDNWNEVLARCTRLEFLSFAYTFAPAAWLGLSQLHTLLNVDLAVVSVATITAALPQLHTLGFVTHYDTNPSLVAGFFDTLLPRLRAFHFGGAWPNDDAPVTTEPSRPLPLLAELIWGSSDIPDRFSAARPVSLCAPASVICILATCTLHRTGSGCCGPLSRARNLRFSGKMPQPSDVAAILRAAPELRTLHAGTMPKRLTWRGDPAFEGLVHRNLRSLRFSPPLRKTDYHLTQLAAECDMLRAHHFPRLRALAIE